MTYEFLHHLTHGKLPVTIYDRHLIKQTMVYENQALVVTAAFKLRNHATRQNADIIQITKITRLGQKAVRSYVRNKKIL